MLFSSKINKSLRRKIDLSYKVKNYSPMSKKARALYLLLVAFGIFSLVRFSIWWFVPDHISQNWEGGLFSLHFFDYLIFIFVSFVIFISLILNLGTWFTNWFMKRPYDVEPQKGLRVAFITCYVPGHEPIGMLRKILVALKNVEYDHDSWVLDEGNDEEAKKLAKELGVRYFTRNGIEEYNQNTGSFRARTKAGNLNSWRNEFEHLYDIVAQVDMDHIPRKNYLTKTLGFFKDPKVGFVGVPQVYKNSDNWIARGASEQTHFFYGPLQQGFYGAHMPFLTGTTHIYRVDAMKGFGGYSPTIAEDYLTGMHFYSNKWKGVYVPEILARGDGPTTWADYFNQQTRWSYGLFEILFKHTHRHFLKLTLHQRINLMFSQLFYFSGLATFFSFGLTVIYFSFGISTARVNTLEWLFYVVPVYLIGQIINIFLHRYYVDPKNEPKIGWRGMFLGQAVGIIYAIALFKFLTRQKINYIVTPKGDQEDHRISLSVFKPHIIMILLTILAVEIGILFHDASPIMAFWALQIIVFLLLVILSGYIPTLRNMKRNSNIKSDILNFRISRVAYGGIVASAVMLFISLPFILSASIPNPDKIISPLAVEESQVESVVQSDEGEAAQDEVIYIVAPNDSLWKISKKFYGSGKEWNKIIDSNPDLIEDSNTVLQLGTRLVIKL